MNFKNIRMYVRQTGLQCSPAHFCPYFLLAWLVYSCFCILDHAVSFLIWSPSYSTLTRPAHMGFHCVRFNMLCFIHPHQAEGKCRQQHWKSLYRYLPFVLYFLRLLTSSLNGNQVFHLFFKTWPNWTTLLPKLLTVHLCQETSLEILLFSFGISTYF